MRVSFHALDRHLRPVLDLSPESLAIFDNGVEVSALSGFRTENDLPLSVALMIDASDSVSRDFAAQQHASNSLVHTLMRSRDDRVMLVAFRDKIDVTQHMTGDPEELAASMRQIRVGGLTALYDALESTSNRLASADSSASRRAIILLSDGDDTDSHLMLNDAIASAVRRDVAVYAITLRSKSVTLQGTTTLKRIADATGGRAYYVRSPEDLTRAMQEIERELRTQYLVTYRTGGGGFHSLRLASKVKDISIRSRAGYFAADGD